jgi:putative transposase
MARAVKQLEMRLPTHGGKRDGAGRKPAGAKAGVSHKKRPALSRHHPVHVTMRVRRDVWNLRSRRCFRAIGRGFAQGKQREGFRLVHFSVQGNHIHLIVEADSAERLARGIQGVAIRLARALNRLMRRRGDVFADRYHAHTLRTPTEVANALAYVLGNFVRHAARRGETISASWVDPCSSAAVAVQLTGPPLVAPAQTWLLSVGWRRRTCRL